MARSTRVALALLAVRHGLLPGPTEHLRTAASRLFNSLLQKQSGAEVPCERWLPAA
jgi:hypothetical protein